MLHTGDVRFDSTDICSINYINLLGEIMKEFIVAKAKNGYVVRTNQGDLYICASLAQVRKLLNTFFEPKDIEVNDPPF